MPLQRQALSARNVRFFGDVFVSTNWPPWPVACEVVACEAIDSSATWSTGLAGQSAVADQSRPLAEFR